MPYWLVGMVTVGQGFLVFELWGGLGYLVRGVSAYRPCVFIWVGVL